MNNTAQDNITTTLTATAAYSRPPATKAQRWAAVVIFLCTLLSCTVMLGWSLGFQDYIDRRHDDQVRDLPVDPTTLAAMPADLRDLVSTRPAAQYQYSTPHPAFITHEDVSVASQLIRLAQQKRTADAIEEKKLAGEKLILDEQRHALSAALPAQVH